MKNWRTTIGGVLSAVGLTLSADPTCNPCHYIGIILAAVGALMVGVNAKDNREDPKP